MSKRWKIIIGVVVALVIVGCVGLLITGAVLFRGRFHQPGWQPGMRPQGQSEEAHHQLEVDLMDDDGDGVPDRGVIELPGEMPFGRGRFDRFGPGHGMRFGGRAFGPFFFVGGLLRLAFLAGVIVLGIVFYRKWRKAHPKVS